MEGSSLQTVWVETRRTQTVDIGRRWSRRASVLIPNAHGTSERGEQQLPGDQAWEQDSLSTRACVPVAISLKDNSQNPKNALQDTHSDLTVIRCMENNSF